MTNNQQVKTTSYTPDLKWTLDSPKWPVARGLSAAATGNPHSSPVIHGHEKTQSEFGSSWMHLCWVAHPGSPKQLLELPKKLLHRKRGLHALPKPSTRQNLLNQRAVHQVHFRKQMKDEPLFFWWWQLASNQANIFWYLSEISFLFLFSTVVIF